MRQTIQNANASLVFNGTSSVVTVATPATGLSSLVSSFAVGGWIYNVTPRASFPVVAQLWGGSGNPTGMQVYIGFGQRLTVKAKIGGTQYDSAVSNPIVPQNKWTHVLVTFDGTTLTGYVDGAASLTVATVGGSVATTNNEIKIGAAAAANWFSGRMLNMVIAPYMTAAQVLALYSQGTVPTGATAVYPLNEGAGSIAYDTSGNGNNGTITSGTWSKDAPTKTRKGVNGNMVYNGDFEIAPVVNVAQTGNYAWINGTVSGTSSTAEPIFGWFKFSYGGTQSAMIDTSELLNGKPSLKLSTTATNSYVGMAINSLDATYHKWNNIPCLPSTSYTASVWVKTSVASGTATTGVQVNIAQMTGTGINSAGSKLNLVTNLVASTGWTQYTGTFTTSATARFLVPELRIVGNDGTATLIADAWFADIQLYPTTAITRSAATGRSTAGTRLSA